MGKEVASLDERILRLEQAAQKINRKIEELKREEEEHVEDILDEVELEEDVEIEEDVDVVEDKSNKKWKKVAIVAGLAVVAGAGVCFATQRPVETAVMVAHHFVHVV